MEHETFDVSTKFQSFGLFVELFVGGDGASHKRIKSMSHSQIQNFCVRGRGGPRPTARKLP